jgi:hypothetical protein
MWALGVHWICMSEPDATRRRILQVGTSTMLTGLAGCLSGDDDSEDSTDDGSMDDETMNDGSMDDETMDEEG